MPPSSYGSYITPHHHRCENLKSYTMSEVLSASVRARADTFDAGSVESTCRTEQDETPLQETRRDKFPSDDECENTEINVELTITTCCTLISCSSDFDPKDGDDTFLRIVDSYADYTTLYPKKNYFHI